MFDLYKTYNKAKDVFAKPKLKVTFGLWRNSYGLPVWRSGPMLHIGKYNQYYRPNFWQHYTVERKGDVKEDGSIVKYDSKGISKHTPPKGCEGFVWKRSIRKKLKKLRLGWIKPVYTLPIWLSFYWFDWDVMYKWKYDTIRYEYPPQFTIVFFGLALTFMLIAPQEDEHDCADFYWESLLSYLYQDECEHDIAKTLNFCGQWTQHLNGVETKRFQLKKAHLNPKYHAEYDRAVRAYNDYLEKKEDKWLY